MNMKTEKQSVLVTFEQAKILKAAGFNLRCGKRYVGKQIFAGEIHRDDHEHVYPAPSQALACEWIKDVKKTCGAAENVPLDELLNLIENEGISDMKKTIAQLKRGFISSYIKTSEFKAFCRTFKSEFKKVLDELGSTNLECRNGHFDIRGFFNSADGRLWYFSLDDVRCMGELRLMVRIAKDRKTHTGEQTRWVNLEDFSDNLRRIIC
jgi:hypothetical protein